MIAKLRRVLIAARYRPGHPGEPTPAEIHAVKLAWDAAAGTLLRCIAMAAKPATCRPYATSHHTGCTWRERLTGFPRRLARGGVRRLRMAARDLVRECLSCWPVCGPRRAAVGSACASPSAAALAAPAPGPRSRCSCGTAASSRAPDGGMSVQSAWPRACRAPRGPARMPPRAVLRLRAGLGVAARGWLRGRDGGGMLGAGAAGWMAVVVWRAGRESGFC
jgi:hypothetical protein